MTRYAMLIAFSIAAVFASSPPSAAGGRDYVSRCQDSSVLRQIERKFAWAERNTWRRGFVIGEIVSPRPRYQVLNGPTLIRHDHCAARAVMTDGKTRQIYYAVDRGMGFASIGDYVRFCVVGLDPWRVYGATCSTAR